MSLARMIAVGAHLLLMASQAPGQAMNVLDLGPPPNGTDRLVPFTITSAGEVLMVAMDAKKENRSRVLWLLEPVGQYTAGPHIFRGFNLLPEVAGDAQGRYAGAGNMDILIGQGGKFRAMRGSGGRETLVDVLAGQPAGDSISKGMSAGGRIVGAAMRTDTNVMAAFTELDGAVEWLPPPQGFKHASANGVNDRGVIVGTAFTTPEVTWASQEGIAPDRRRRGVLWRGQNPVLLNTLLSAGHARWQIIGARAVNARGQILALAENTQGEMRCVVLAPAWTDFNGDGHSDKNDLADFVDEFYSGTPSQRLDFNEDGKVDIDDLDALTGALAAGAPPPVYTPTPSDLKHGRETLKWIGLTEYVRRD